jgi:outer membrane protein assembly factor BamB
MTRLCSLGLPVSALMVLAAAVVGARDATEPGGADWPQFRGPRRDNLSPDKGLLKTWPRGGPRLVWKGTGVGQGFSSVAIAGNRVYTMGDKAGSAWAFALDRGSGKLLWSARVGKAGGSTYVGTRCTPTVDGSHVYVLGQFGDLVCLDNATGAEKWRKNLPADFGGRSGNWNFTESPLIDGDRLICTPGGRSATLVALNKLTGEVVWKAPLGDTAGYSSIVISHAAGVKQYVQLTANGTLGVDARDGKLLWRYQKLRTTANIPTPVVLGDHVFTAAGYDKGGGALLTLESNGDGVKVKEEYFKKELQNRHGGVTVVGDLVFADVDHNGRPYCAEWKTGEIKWQRTGRGTGQSSASITYADGHLYVRYSNGWVALVPATAAGYKEVGGFKIPNSDRNSWAHPVVIGGRLYLREKDTVWCYDVTAK